MDFAARRARKIRKVLVYFAIASATCGPARATNYPPYVDLDTFLGELGLVNVSGVITADSVTTGTDSNGGFVKRATNWEGAGGGALGVAPASDPTKVFGLGGPYFGIGYTNSALPIALSPGSSNLTNDPPAPAPPEKPQAQIDNYNNWAFVMKTTGGFLETVSPLCLEAAPACFAAGALSGSIGLALSVLAGDPSDPNYTMLVVPSVGNSFCARYPRPE